MKTHRGSALLVVLGMLSFMIVSGLAFSVYMRSTRLPSSFTRRIVTTRQLAKGALAAAIDQIDRAIANDPHPNIRLNDSNDYNYWLGRVLVSSYKSTDDNGRKTEVKPRTVINQIESSLKSGSDGDAGQTDGDVVRTVPVLSLEALAYLPPSLVNEARAIGQKSPTAAWQSFDFDAGRYAFIALDVSDYFDVNRILADEPRSSNPARRISFSHLFEDDHTSQPGDANAWDNFMDGFRAQNADGTFGFSSKVPLVSLADFNLALGRQSLGGMKSPFVQYLEGSGGSVGFYGSSPGSAQFEKYGEMTFVTESLEAPVPAAELTTAGGETIRDLDDEQNQIFTEAFLDAPQEDRALISISSLKTKPFADLVQQRIPYVTMFNLSDYLDCDRIPISLGIPSVERVPMICGIKPAIGSAKANVSIVKNAENGGSDKEISGSMANKDPVVKVQRNVRWRLDAASLAGGFMGGQIQTLAVYPFRNLDSASENVAFNLDGKVQLFLSSEEMRLRTGNSDDLLHWAASGNATSGGDAKLLNNAVMNLPLQAESITLDQKPSDPSKCVMQLNLDLSSSASKIATELADEKGDILNVTYEWERKLVDEKTGEYDNGYETDLPPADKITAASSALRPLKCDGTLDADFSDDMTKSVADLDKTLRLNFVVTLRVTSSSGEVLGEGSSGTKTVDMVPATLYDDKPLNNVDNSMGLSAGLLTDLTGQPTPLMKFETGVSFPVKLSMEATCNSEIKLTPTAVMVDDPRYNHAPENWKVLDSFSEAGWYSAQSSAGRDGDIFMATSDQDYMQSVYEIGFLPRLSNLESRGEPIRGDLPGYPSAASSWTKLCAETPIDANFMWKTYDVLGRYSNDGDDFEGLGFENRGRGLRVNPYSDSTNVIMAAFANTPHDWRAASENEDENAAADLSGAAFAKKYAWNEYSSGQKLAWEDLELVAGAFMGRVAACARKGETWQDALGDLFRTRSGTDDNEQYLCGIQLESPSDKLYSVDKKFLYGYWRNCFAARQQLFLVFFRAEPMMLGGGVAGVTPPQLGAKGVAVVWRDPNATSGSQNNNGSGSTGYIPHKTRVLFYKQFE